MKSKGAVKLFAIAMSVVSIFQLSFTYVTYRIEKEAKEFADGDVIKERAYLDSIAREPVYNLGFAEYTYLQCKERELNLGLDLKGGMNVTLEVSLGDMFRSLANNNPDVAFNKAIDLANEKMKTSQSDFVTLFGQAYKETAPDGKLAAIFANQTNKDKIKISSSNDEVLRYLRDEANQAIDRSFQILRARIDKFGVTQPNIQKLEGSGRILVELPGVDNPARVRKLLQGSAKLEFWETYDNAEAYKYLSTANEMLVKVMKMEGGNGTSSTDSNASSATDTVQSALAGLGATTTVATDTAKKDTANGEKTFEQFSQENPLFAYLRPYADDQNMLVAKGSACGIAMVKDTAKVNAMLNRPEVRNVLPSSIKFFWAYKGFGNNGEAVILHAIKASKDGKPALEGDKITDARRDISQTGDVEVSMSMNAEGARIWKNLTKQNIGKSVSIVLDDVVYSSPTVQNEIPNGRSSITGSFTNEEAGDLANILKSGKLPAPTHIVEEAVVGATLGQEAISQGLWSMVIGTLVVLIFMVIYYNNSGYIVDIAVLFNVFFTLGVLASLGAALTLPGIAGIVLTVGMAVDANVLINERVKDELYAGRSLKNAVTDGYAAASSSIIDANLTTLLAGIVMYAFGTGPIQGFAITLIIGILTTMFTAVLLTRVITDWRVEKGQNVKFSRPFSARAFKNLKVDWVGTRKIYYIISSTIIGIGLISMFTKGFSLGVDFQGGWSYVVQFDKEVSGQEIREKLAPYFDNNAPEVKTFASGGNKYKITTTYMINETSAGVSEAVESKLEEGLATIGAANILSSAKVGPTMANDIKVSAIWASIIALLGIGLYIFARFREWRYSVGATIALAHDALMMLTFYSLLDGVLPFAMEVDQNFIAAILTIIGFSINDTVVVFDRIREFFGTHQHETDKKSVINGALNDMMNRTIITSFTVFLVTFVLFIFGGDVMRGFTFSLMIGIIFGTFSSISIAAPIVLDLERKKKDK